MAAHKTWVQQGMNEKAFLAVGSLKPEGGGCIIAPNTERALLEKRISEDPFVKENIVHAEIIEVEPSKVDERLSFLMD